MDHGYFLFIFFPKNEKNQSFPGARYPAVILPLDFAVLAYRPPARLRSRHTRRAHPRFDLFRRALAALLLQ